MPADEERQVAQGLSRLRSDLDRVAWADAESVRRRGRHRTQQQLAAGTLAVTLGIGMVGVTIAGWQPWANDSSLVADPGSAQSRSAASSEHEPDTSSGHGNTSPEDRGTGEQEVSPGEPRTNTTEVREPTHRLDPSPGDSDDDTPSADDPPTNTSPPTSKVPDRSVSPAPVEAVVPALLAADEMPVSAGATSSWSEQGTREGEGSTRASVCAAASLEALGATDVLRRDYTWSGPEPAATGVNAVAVFASPEAAKYAFDEYADWAASCSWGEERYGPSPVAVDEGTARWWWARQPATETSAGAVEVLGLVQSGTAVSVVSWHREGAAFASGEEPMAATLTAAAERIKRYAGS